MAKTYTGRLVGPLPFSSVDVVVPGEGGVGKTVLLGRDKRSYSEAEKSAFEKLAAQKGSPIAKENLDFAEASPKAKG